MSHIIPALTWFILTVNLCQSIINPLQQTTDTGKEPRITNHSEPIKHCIHKTQHPNINITSSEGIIVRNVNSTYTLLKTHNPEVTLTCYSDYPIEWVFTEKLSTEGVNIRERREWITTDDQLFVSDFSFPRNSSVKNVTCRAATRCKQCKQTTVQFNRTEYSGIIATSVQVHRDFPQGELLEQYFNPEEGNNINCSIQIVNNPNTERFSCYSLEFKKGEAIRWQFEESSNKTLCYDPFRFGLLYNKQATERCKHTPKGIKFHAIHTHSCLGSFSGIVTCKPSYVRGFEGRPTVHTSATSHYFRALPDFCNKASPGDFQTPKLYVDRDPLSLDEEERSYFMSFCELDKDLYTGDVKEFSCMTSVYLFAEGLVMEILYKNLTGRNVTDITLVNADNPRQIRKDGYRTYTAEVHIDSKDILKILCSAPLRRSIFWNHKEIPLNVLSSINLTMEGSVKETVEVVEGEDVYLRCYATAVPKPEYEWTYISKTDNEIPNSWIQVNEVDGSNTLIIPAPNVTVASIVTCTASNRRSSARKTFALKVPTAAQAPSAAEVPWVAILVPMVLIVVGCVIGFLVWNIIRIKRKLGILSQAELDEFMEGRPDVLLNTKSNSQDDFNSYAMCLPYNKNYEVLKGILTNKAGDERVAVAIKTLKPMDDISYFKALMSELKIMGFIGEHRNIINLLGAYTKNLQNREIFIAIELCENGCMLNYLRNHRSAFINLVANGTLQQNLTGPTEHHSSLNSITLMRWSMQIANGMDFLNQKRVIHGDLAARNILLSENLTAKIGDFGLSRQLYEYVNYIKEQQSPLPWKWLAIECLQDMNFSSQSDAWAYGITLWEVFSLGHSPYPGCTYNEEFIDSLVVGKRPSRPQFAADEVYDVMTKCWSHNPSNRPSFSEITIFFDNAIRGVTSEDYMELKCASDKNLPA